jgi:hypothetical protein
VIPEPYKGKVFYAGENLRKLVKLVVKLNLYFDIEKKNLLKKKKRSLKNCRNI